MTVPSITPLPASPSTSDPTNFPAEADALLAALPTMVTEENLSIAGINAAVIQTAADVVSSGNSASAAAGSQSAAAVSAAAALAAPGTNATSTTSASIGTGAKSLTIQTGKSYVAGMWVQAADAAAPATNFMAGVVTAYDSVTGVLDFTVIAGMTMGSGTKTSWVVSVTGRPTDIPTLLFGKQAIPVMAGSIIPRTTNGAAPGLTETTTNKIMRQSLDYDASTIEHGQFSMFMPKSWNLGAVSFIPIWVHGATTTNFKVSWGLQAVAISDGDAGDAAFGTAIYSNDTGGTTGTIYAGPESAAVTVAGTPAAQDLVVFQILRKADDGTNDTLAVDASLLGFILFITNNAGTDA